jgi:broad specificity phosphatase PhoE
MTKQTTIYIVRHGLSEANKANIMSGHSNAILSEEGRVQASEAKKAMAHIVFDEVYSSDLDRAIETVSIIHGQAVPDHHKLAGLRERNFGVIEGRPAEEFDKFQKIKMSLPHKERSHYKYAEGMESDHELASRYLESLHKIVDDHPGLSILVGSHGSAMRSLLVGIGWATHDELLTGSIKNTGYIKLVHDGKEFVVDEVAGVTVTR